MYRAEEMVEEQDSSLHFRVPGQARPAAKSAKPVEVRDQAICERATRAYYRDELGPYPADGVAVVRLGDRFAVLGDRHAGEWAILEIYNLKFELIGGFGS